MEILYVILTCMGLTFLYFANKQYEKTKQLLATGIQTKARVIDVLKERSDDRYMYRPVFEYENKNGETIVYESNFRSNPAAYSIGDTVKLVYSRSGDERKIVSFWGLYLWPVILLCFALPTLLIPIVYYFYSNG